MLTSAYIALAVFLYPYVLLKDMKFFIAGYIQDKETVKQIYGLIRQAGHEIVTDWTNDDPVTRDDPNFFQEKQKRAVRDLEGVMECDVFVILAEPIDGRAKYSEFGIALMSNVEKGTPHLFVVGEDTTRSLFFFHPAVKHKKSIEEVLEELNGI